MVESLTNQYGRESRTQPWKCTVSHSDRHIRAELGCHTEFIQLAVGS